MVIILRAIPHALSCRLLVLETARNKKMWQAVQLFACGILVSALWTIPQVAVGGPTIPFTYEEFSDRNCKTRSRVGTFSLVSCKTLPETVNVFVNGSFKDSTRTFEYNCDPGSYFFGLGTNCEADEMHGYPTSLICMKSRTKSYRPLCPTPAPSKSPSRSPSVFINPSKRPTTSNPSKRPTISKPSKVPTLR